MLGILANAFWLVIVGLLWGCTNPLLKRGSKGVTELPARSNPVSQFIAEQIYLFTRYQYVLPLGINLCGSVIFFWSLGSSDLSLIVPITNSLTFFFTILMSRWLGEQQLRSSTLAGLGLVLVGISVCVLSKAK